MAAQNNKSTSIRKTALNVLMVVFFTEMTVYGAIKGFEGSWLGWVMVVGFLPVIFSASKGKLSSWAYSGIANTVMLVVVAIGAIAQAKVLFDLVVSL